MLFTDYNARISVRNVAVHQLVEKTIHCVIVVILWLWYLVILHYHKEQPNKVD